MEIVKLGKVNMFPTLQRTIVYLKTILSPSRLFLCRTIKRESRGLEVGHWQVGEQIELAPRSPGQCLPSYGEMFHISISVIRLSFMVVLS